MANTNYISNVNPRDWTSETAGFTPGDGEKWYYHSHPDYSGVIFIYGDGSTAFDSLTIYSGDNEFPEGLTSNGLVTVEDQIVVSSDQNTKLNLNETGTGNSGMSFSTSGDRRWVLQTEGANDRFSFARYIADVFQDLPFYINNTDGNALFANDLAITGALSKGSGSFKIDHPLKPGTHYLAHSFIEGPQADNIYRGKVPLVKGAAKVNIDVVAGMTEGTFEALNREVQVFTTNESGWSMVKGSVDGNILAIEAQNACDDIISWMVIGERKDKHMMGADWTDNDGKVIVEPLKKAEKK